MPTRKYTKTSDLDKLGRISHRLISWLETSLTAKLKALKGGGAQAVEEFSGSKNSLLSMLVILIDVASRLEKAKKPEILAAPIILAQEEAPSFSEADVALVKTYLDKLPQ